MMMKWSIRSAVTALLLAPAMSGAQGSVPNPCTGIPIPTSLSSPFALVAVNSTCLDLSSLIRATTPGKVWSLDANVTVAAAELHVFGTFNADPFVTIGATSTNPLAGPVTYSFVFGTPIVPDFYNTASSTGGVSLTNGVSGQAMVTTSGIAPAYISGYATNGADVDNLGVDLGTAPCVANGLPFMVTQTCPQGTTTNTFPPTFYNNLLALLTYDQTDVASTASWSGAVTLTAAPPTSSVPEPSTLLLVAGGLAAAGGVAVTRRPLLHRRGR
jgi:hypothetical protein